MKIKKMLTLLIVAVVLLSCDNRTKTKSYNTGRIVFENMSPETEGSKIFCKIFPDPEITIEKLAIDVLKTIYFSPEDSIPHIRVLNFKLKNYKGISAKSGKSPEVTIVYSTQWIKQTHKDSILYETSGVLTHELTHAYQLEPQGIGNYHNNNVFKAFIEGLADAVRVKTGFFESKDRPKGGNYINGYRYTGFFFAWISDKYDKDFLRKMNKSTLYIKPWSFDGAVKYSLGEDFDIDELWKEYSESV